jgi:hypothetical protein
VPVGDPANNVQLAALVAQLEAQGMQQLRQLGQQLAGGGEQQQQPDPLIALKQQELQIRAQDNQMDNQIAQQKVALEQQRMQQRATDFQEKMASQERMTAEKIQAARERELLRQRGQQ